MSNGKVALLVGAGDAIGAAVARRFAKGGYTVCIGRRNGEKSAALAEEIARDGGRLMPFSVDARSEEEVKGLFAKVEADIGPVEVCLFNAGANVKEAVTDTSAELFLKVWKLGCYSGFLIGREAAQRMLPRGRGTILFTGATASTKGRHGFAAFASTKFALRGLAQAMARELGPKNIHVAHLVIDGGVDSDAIRKRLRAAGTEPDDLGENRLVNTASIAEAYWYLHAQAPDGWTHELDIRPFGEVW